MDTKLDLRELQLLITFWRPFNDIMSEVSDAELQRAALLVIV